MLQPVFAAGPDRIALRTETETLSYRQLDAMVGAVAAGLAARGLAPGDRLALLLPNGIDLVVAILAAWRAGLVLVALSSEYAPPQIAAFLAATRARGLVAAPALLARLPAVGAAGLEVEILTGADDPGPGRHRFADLLAGEVSAVPVPDEPDPLALIVFTSGTTGEPKGVVHSQARLAARTEGFVREMELGADDVALLVFSAARPVGLVTQVLAMLRVGGTVWLAERPAPEVFWRIYAQARPTFFLLMPAYASRILAEPGADRLDHARLRYTICGGDRSSLDLHRRARAVTGRKLLALFGMTEVGTIFIPRPSSPDCDGAIGWPLPGVEVRLVDEAGRPVPPGGIGRAQVRSPTMMVGYWNDTLRTHRALATGWLDTQDLMRRDETGCLWFVGRANEMIVRNAVNVASVQVIEALTAHPAIAEARLVGLPDPVEGQLPVAFYRLHPGAEAPAAARLHDWVAARVDRDSIPAGFLAVESWPTTPQGKVDPRQLRALAEQARPTLA
ncbi:class I adenylate-forming enzyme family protein [Phaeospirillum tilakii]|uniref:Class I adenylate-forming enzyme family protein n=1 Tax=Phaeospirillum tilakii TaxID=741673 RepID=A0ABW5C9F4_9PROT